MPENSLKADSQLGLCLAGGGGLGFLHLGLFKAMEELGIRPGVIAGTSSGAVLGAFYALGKTASEIREIMQGFKWMHIVSPAIPLRGYLSTSRMQAFYKRHMGDLDIADLPLRLKIAAVDLHSGELAVFTKGPLAKCLAASCTVPGIFEPVVIDGRSFYDAGGIYNLPLELLNGENLKTIIAGNTIGEFGLMKAPKSVQDTVYQAYLIRSMTLTAWRTGPSGWPGRKNERLVMIDYHSDGVNPRGVDDCLSIVDNIYHQSLKVLSKAFGK
jgi:NTE family protein